jgi:protein involved in polysaccharide export with SLBB domain
MEFALIRRFNLVTHLLEPALRATVVIILSMSIVFAQGIQLSPEQQQMLNQLPPAQRQQAMDAIRQLQSQQSTQGTQSSQSIREEPSAVQNADLISAVLASSAEAIPTAKARSRIVIDFTPRDSLTKRELIDLEQNPLLMGLRGSQLYVLDEGGALSLAGFDTIPLLGLVEEDIERRVGAEPYLSPFDIDVRILGQESIGIDALEPFGYDVFEPKRTTFDAPSTGPVPPDYVLGPGDTVRVQLFGNVNGIYEYEVSRDGILNLPEIGPVTVAGLPFSEFRADLNKRVREMLIGTQVSVTMGLLRTIRVFVLGDANQPGSYVVSGLATIGSVLYQSGGVSRVGSLRNIQLKRSGRIVTTLDLYDVLLQGDTSADKRLQPGDVIFVPPIGNTIGVSGAVKRPAIYETKGAATIADAVQLAGGLASDAFGKGARIERVDGERTTIAVDLTSTDSSRLKVRSGDTLIVPDVLPNLEDTVVLAGHVFRPGNYEWRPGMRLTDLIGSTDELKPGVDPEYVLIRREIKRGEPVQVLSTNLIAALKAPSGADNVRLEASDTVHVFSLALGRQRIVEPLLEELRLQSTIDAPALEVQISGNVRAPGVYPLESQMRVSDLIRAGGNLSEKAYALEAELTRYSSTGGSSRDIDVVQVDLDAVRQGVDSADLALREHDYLIIKRIPDWDKKWTVTLEGEVQFPGEYRVRRSETLGEVLQRAGGLTDDAFPEGAVFLRETLKEQEQEQIETLARRLEADLANLSLQASAAGEPETLTTGRVLLDQLRSTEAVGRLVLDMTQDDSGRYSAAAGVELRDGDQLLVPTQPQVVTVLGETQQNTSHLYRDQLTRDEYIDLSGGLTRRADKKLIYVVRANGAVIAGNRSRWLGRGKKVDIRPGDTIVVPLDTDRMRPLTFWGNVTQILYQAAIAVAAVKTFDN